jgi:hypothetical protein
MKITPVHKLPYDGPKTHRSILMRIHEEAQEQGKNLSLLYIQKTVGVFFSAIGFPYYFKLFLPFIVNGIGRWGPTRKGRNLRKKLEHKIAVKARRKERKQQTLNRKDRKRYLAKKYQLQLHLDLVRRFNKRNELMVEKGLRPWTWEQYCKLTHYEKFISWGTKTYDHHVWRPRDFLPLR